MKLAPGRLGFIGYDLCYDLRLIYIDLRLSQGSGQGKGYAIRYTE